MPSSSVFTFTQKAKKRVFVHFDCIAGVTRDITGQCAYIKTTSLSCPVTSIGQAMVEPPEASADRLERPADRQIRAARRPLVDPSRRSVGGAPSLDDARRPPILPRRTGPPDDSTQPHLPRTPRPSVRTREVQPPFSSGPSSGRSLSSCCLSPYGSCQRLDHLL